MNKKEAPYWIEDYLIEPDRNQITRLQHITTLQPKVLAVLNLLAKNAGSVVTHQELMESVWADTYVSPNTLQRCIAELRRALGDNSKTQAIIKTHSKRGYSLEANVKLAFESPSSTVQDDTKPKSDRRPWLLPIALFTIAIIFLGVWFSGTQKQELVFDQLKPMTATDQKEYFADYSPDGRFLVFHRYIGVCENHIWAKDLQTQEEFRLTTDSAVYGQHSWSSDGSQLAFTKQQNCIADIDEKSICWQLHTLDFAMALREPQQTIERLDCKEQRISKPKWLADGRILMLEHSTPTKLVSYKSSTDSLDEFYTSEDLNISHFDHDETDEQVAVFALDDLLKNHVFVLNTQGELQSHYDWLLPDDLSVFQRIEPNFSPDGQNFILNTTQGLFEVSKEGQFDQIHFEGMKRIFTPAFNDDGDKFLATIGPVDADIGLLKLGEHNSASIIARSNSYDAGGKFQPNGDHVAFSSRRSGSPQIWLVKDEQVWQLSDFEHNTHVTSLVWSNDGSQLVTIANDRLSILSLQGELNQLDLPYRVDSVFQWIDDIHLLIEANIGSARQLAILNTDELSIDTFNVYDPIFAYYQEDYGLFYVDQDRNAWREVADQRLFLSALNGQLDGKRFTVSAGSLYSVNWRNQLWRYDFQQDAMTFLQTMPDTLWWVSDVRGEQVLITELISSRQEIVELSRSH